MAIPTIAFGACAICGRRAADNGGSSSAQVEARYTSKRGLNLELFRGQYVCSICKEDELSEERSRYANAKRAREDRFRAKAGIRRS